jgi:hypothetical protein
MDERKPKAPDCQTSAESPEKESRLRIDGSNRLRNSSCVNRNGLEPWELPYVLKKAILELIDAIVSFFYSQGGL